MLAFRLRCDRIKMRVLLVFMLVNRRWKKMKTLGYAATPACLCMFVRVRETIIDPTLQLEFGPAINQGSLMKYLVIDPKGIQYIF